MLYTFRQWRHISAACVPPWSVVSSTAAGHRASVYRAQSEGLTNNWPLGPGMSADFGLKSALLICQASGCCCGPRSCGRRPEQDSHHESGSGLPRSEERKASRGRFHLTFTYIFRTVFSIVSSFFQRRFHSMAGMPSHVPHVFCCSDSWKICKL